MKSGTHRKIPPIGKIRAGLRLCLKNKDFKMVAPFATFFKRGDHPCDFHSMTVLAKCFEAMGHEENAKWCRVRAKRARSQGDEKVDAAATDNTSTLPASNVGQTSPLTPPRAEPALQGGKEMQVLISEDREPEEPLDPINYVSKLKAKLNKPMFTEELLLPKLEELNFERFESDSRREMTVKLRIPLATSSWNDEFGFNILAHGKARMTQKDLQGGERALTNARNRAAEHAIHKIADMCRKIDSVASGELQKALNSWFAGLRRDNYVDKCYQAFKRARDLIFSSAHDGLYSAKVFLYGSASTGLVLGDSDIDVAVAVPISKSLENPRDAHADILAFLQRSVERSMSDVELIPKAKVPVLRYHDQDAKVDVDITIANDKSVLLSRLLRKHLKCDVRIWELCMAVKYWARRRRISGTPEGHINPMGWIVMVIYFLQHHVSPSIGNLFKIKGSDPAHAVITQVPWSKSKGCGRSQAKTGELLLQFFEFFGYKFDFANQAISINMQCPETVRALIAKQHGGVVFIEQPLQLGVNVVDYVKATTLDIIRTELRRGYNICKITGDGHSLFMVRQKTENESLFGR